MNKGELRETMDRMDVEAQALRRRGLRTCLGLPSDAWCPDCREGFPGNFAATQAAERASAINKEK